MDLHIIIPVLMVTIVVGPFLYKSYKLGGFKAAIFDAKIDRNVGTIELDSDKLLKMKLNIFSLDQNSHDKAVGIEQVSKSFASFSKMSITLSKEQALEFAQLLTDAVNES